MYSGSVSRSSCRGCHDTHDVERQRVGNAICAGRNAMKNTVVKVLVIASALSPLTAFAQAGKTAPTTATYIMKEEIDKVGATEQSKSTRDENVKVVGLGYENFAVGIVHRGSTR